MTLPYLRALAGLAVPLALAACSSSGTSDVAPEQLTYGQYKEQAQELSSGYTVLGFTDPATLPVSGDVSYVGYMGFESESIPAIVGEMRVNVDFGGAAGVSGVAQNFITEGGELFTGVLDLSGGSINRNAPLGTASLEEVAVNGILTDENARAYEYDASFDAFFYGQNMEGFSGGGNDGRIVFSGGSFSVTPIISVVAAREDAE